MSDMNKTIACQMSYLPLKTDNIEEKVKNIFEYVFYGQSLFMEFVQQIIFQFKQIQDIIDSIFQRLVFYRPYCPVIPLIFFLLF